VQSAKEKTKDTTRKLLFKNNVDNGETAADMAGGKAEERRRVGERGGRETREAPPQWRRIGENERVIRRPAKIRNFRNGGRVRGRVSPT
jgi:hypothetical protein